MIWMQGNGYILGLHHHTVDNHLALFCVERDSVQLHTGSERHLAIYVDSSPFHIGYFPADPAYGKYLLVIDIQNNHSLNHLHFSALYVWCQDSEGVLGLFVQKERR